MTAGNPGFLVGSVTPVGNIRDGSARPQEKRALDATASDARRARKTYLPEITTREAKQTSATPSRVGKEAVHLELELGVHDVGEIVEQQEHCSDPRKRFRDLADHLPPVNHSAGNHHRRCRRGRRRPCRKFFGSRVKRFIGDVALVMGPVIGRERLYKRPSGFKGPFAKGNTTLSLSHIRRARSFEPFYLLECSTRSCVRRSVLACSSEAEARFDLVPPSCLHAHLRRCCSGTIPGI